MSQNLPENYRDEVPEHVDMSKSDWEELSYHGQYHHAERNKERVRKVKKQRRDRKKYWLNRIKSEKECAICDEEEPCCLVYHHLEDKEFNLGDVSRNDISKERMKKELNKCVVLCSNCHRKTHAGVFDINQKI